MEPVTLSVCIPVFNCREHISQAVDSVLAQTYSDFELIIVDNCSDDGTYELLSQYADPRIKLLRNASNIGACGNWNRILREFSGRYLKILCADDILYPDCLERQLAVLEAADAAVMMVTNGRDIIDEQGRKVFRRQYPGSGGRVPGQEVIRKTVLRGANIIGEVSHVTFRREAVAKAGEFDGSIPYVIDLDYWVRVLQHGDLFVLPEYLSAYRVSGASWSVAITTAQADNFSTFITKINKTYGVALSSLDMLVGRFMARLNSQLRKVFYKLYLR
jgi:glycosyltransferase involved in cell wall biosynthesis